jgi:UDP-GlcNAc:undecaprenyl-phosphate/decaprenyl-phosphate GlcNAc-1-phosphate transferase
VLGPAVGLAAMAGVAASGPDKRRAVLLMVTGAALIGGYDDRYGDRHARGLAGHANALLAGRLTTGVIKLVTLAGVAAVGSAVAHRKAADVAIGTVLVAGGANLVNLFDLRPGRAAKVSLLAATALGCRRAGPARQAAAVAAGVAAAALPPDLAEHGMLGDCGASTLGALLGCSASLAGPRWQRSLIAAGVVALTLASERVSFSAVIEGQPALRALDRLGRQPE